MTEAMEVLNHEAIMPRKILTKKDLGVYAGHLERVLLEENNALEAYVMVKQMEELVKQLKDKLIDKALVKTVGKDGEVSGAKYSIRTTKKYEYDAPTLAMLEQEVTTLNARMKLIKNTIEGGEVFVDVDHGFENRAKCVSIGQQLAITLPKE